MTWAPRTGSELRAGGVARAVPAGEPAATGAVWGADVNTAIINKLIECSVEGTDIDAKLAELQSELIALIG